MLSVLLSNKQNEVMKLKSKYRILKATVASFFFMLLLVGCQDEFEDIREPDRSVAITANDSIATLVLKVVLKDGSFDNIIDRCSEISINFPYTVLIDDRQYLIDSYDEVEEIRKNYFFDRDDIEIVYPVTVAFSDYSEMTISDDDELEDIQERYNTLLADDDIECIDFEFPLEVSFFDEVRQVSDVVTVNNDFEMYDIFDSVDDLVIEIGFPVVLITLSGERTTVNNNIQLAETIAMAEGRCDEEDEVEFDDDDFYFYEFISTGKWIVGRYSDTTDETASFSGYTFTFTSDLAIRASNGGDVTYGDWELDTDDSNIYIDISFDTDEFPLERLNQEWLIASVNDDIIELEAESDDDGHIMNLQLVRSN
jgi:hypothetical protein